jgi:hypothetical protein
MTVKKKYSVGVSFGFTVLAKIIFGYWLKVRYLKCLPLTGFIISFMSYPVSTEIEMLLEISNMAYY